VEWPVAAALLLEALSFAPRLEEEPVKVTAVVLQVLALSSGYYSINIMFDNIRPPKTTKDHMKCRWVIPNSKKTVPFCGSLGIHSEH
jgi:hypothetical protein